MKREKQMKNEKEKKKLIREKNLKKVGNGKIRRTRDCMIILNKERKIKKMC